MAESVITQLNKLGGTRPPFVPLTSLTENKTYKIIWTEKNRKEEGALYTGILLHLTDDDASDTVFRTSLPSRLSDFLIANPDKYDEFAITAKYFQYCGTKKTAYGHNMALVSFPE